MANNSAVRSWNDPPVLKFDSAGTATKHRLLNKRVFSPLGINEKPQTSLTGDSQNCSEDGSEKFNVTVTNPSVTNDKLTPDNNDQKEGSRENCDIPISNIEILNFVSTTLRKILDESSEKCEKTLKEIDRRLNIMEKSWESEISQEVKHMMFKMAQELCNGNVDAALKIHCSLMVQNVREVKNWMVGVKRIIEMKKKNQSLPTVLFDVQESCD